MTNRILIADDAKLVRTALRDLLKKENGCEVVEAENGSEAVAKARDTRPDLVILDLAMPVMDGLTATREINKLLPNVPIVMYTLHCSSQLEVDARKVGVARIVPKSDSGFLLSVVHELLDGALRAPIAS